MNKQKEHQAKCSKLYKKISECMYAMTLPQRDYVMQYVHKSLKEAADKVGTCKGHAVAIYDNKKVATAVEDIKLAAYYNALYMVQQGARYPVAELSFLSTVANSCAEIETHVN